MADHYLNHHRVCVPGTTLANPDNGNATDAMFDAPTPREDKPSPRSGKDSDAPAPRVKPNAKSKGNTSLRLLLRQKPIPFQQTK